MHVLMQIVNANFIGCNMADDVGKDLAPEVRVGTSVDNGVVANCNALFVLFANCGCRDGGREW